jgi:glycosyl transferase family 87
MPVPRGTLRWIVTIAVFAAVLYIVARQKRDFVDFAVYRTAAERALGGEALYRAEDGHYQFKYWPAFAFAMAPFAIVPPEAARVIWFALSALLMVLFVRGSIQLLPDRRRSARWLSLLTALLIAKFVVKELVNGQTNLLLATLLLAAVWFARRARPALAGVLTGMAVFVKPYAILFLPWLAVTQGAAAIAASLVVVAVGLVLPAVVYGWQGNLDLLTAWYHTVRDTTPANLTFPENISLASMWAKWLGPGSMASALAWATAAALLAVAAVAWRRRRQVNTPDYLELGLLLLLVPLLSPQGWDYVLILAVPAIVCLLDRWKERSTPWRVLTGVGFALTSFTIYDLLGRTLYMRLMQWSVITVGAIMLVASLAHLRLKKLA